MFDAANHTTKRLSPQRDARDVSRSHLAPNAAFVLFLPPPRPPPGAELGPAPSFPRFDAPVGTYGRNFSFAMSNLVIVESPAKAHTVGRILGQGWKVLPSVGHVRDLPERDLGISISPDGRHFEPQYEISPEKQRIVSDLVRAAKQADEIYLASDPDREGEAIAWHIREIISAALRKAGVTKPFHRVEYNEITPRAVRNAIANPHDVDMDRVNAQQARRLLDRLVGWKVSPSLRRAAIPAAKSHSLSAGRVQSVALRMVCEREKAIRDFKPVRYWLFSAMLAKREGDRTPFAVQLRELGGKTAEVHDEATASAVMDMLKTAAYSVGDVATGRKKRTPPPPFTTSTLQQSASTALGFAPDLTMRLAQSLYESSLITYMRTDSQAVSRDAQAAAGDFIRAQWGAEFANPHTYANRAGAQAAHECVRPTDPALVPDEAIARLSSERDGDRMARLYGLIWRRFVASQMSAAEYETLEVSVEARKHGASASSGATAARDTIPDALLRASTSRLVFPGFLRASGAAAADDGYNPNAARRPDSDDDKGGAETTSDAVSSLPPLASGEELDLPAPADGSPNPKEESKETKPPPRYNEASLVRALEKNGIGRPSTFASVIATLKNRDYVASQRRVLSPTELGEKVNDYLVPHFPELMDIGFTAEMEKKLDEVEDPERKLDWQAMLADFNAKLRTWLEQSRGPAADPEALRRILADFSSVKKWAEPRGGARRSFSDLAFVQDVANDFCGIGRGKRKTREGGEDASAPQSYCFDPALGPAREFSERLLRSVASILLRYREQVPDAEDAVRAAGLGDMLDDESLQPPDPRTLRLVDILSQCGVEERSREFFESLSAQVRGGRRLSPKQSHWLGEMFLEARDRVPGFSPELCAELGVQWREKPAPVDAERVSALIAGLAHVKEWNKPVKRGRRTFDDREFVASVTAQFSSRHSLSEAQLGVLDRMFLRYRDQIPDADAIVARFGVKAPERAPRRSFPARKKA